MVNPVASFVGGLDFMGEYYVPEVEGNQRFKSFVGGVLSLIILITTFVLGILFSGDLFERQYPVVTTSVEMLTSSEVNSDDMNLLISFHTPDGIPVSNPWAYISYTIYLLEITGSNSNNMDNLRFYNLQLCDFNKLKNGPGGSSYSDLNNDQIKYYCLQDNLKIQNGFTELPSKTVFINFDRCIDNCANDIDKVLDNCYITLKLLNSYADYKDYKNPIKYYISSITQRLSISGGLKTTSYVRIINNKLLSSDGYLLDNISAYSYFSLDSRQTEMAFGNNEFFYSMRIESPRRIEVSYRKYITIQDILAKI